MGSTENGRAGTEGSAGRLAGRSSVWGSCLTILSAMSGTRKRRVACLGTFSPSPKSSWGVRCSFQTSPVWTSFLWTASSSIWWKLRFIVAAFSLARSTGATSSTGRSRGPRGPGGRKALSTKSEVRGLGPGAAPSAARCRTVCRPSPARRRGTRRPAPTGCSRGEAAAASALPLALLRHLRAVLAAVLDPPLLSTRLSRPSNLLRISALPSRPQWAGRLGAPCHCRCRCGEGFGRCLANF